MGSIHIEFSTGPNSGKVMQLSNQTLIFGRTSVSDVLLDWDGLVSSRHFKILKDQDRFVLHDLGSTNGTLVNGKPVRSHELANGDQITVGKTILLVKEVVDTNATSEEKVYANPFESVREPITDQSDDFAFMERPQSRVHLDQAQPPVREMSPLSAEVAWPSEATAEKVAAQKASGDIDPREFSSGFTQVRLRVASSEGNGKLFWLNLGQSSTFGRTEKSDCSVPSDPSLSSKHFRVTCEADQCTIEDLQSRTGVWLNGKKISKAQLSNGDLVLAGETEFLVEIQGIAAAISATEPGNVSPSIQNSPKLRASTKRIYDVSSSQCASGIVRLRGKVFEDEGQAEVGIVELFETVHAFASLQVLIDFSRISLPLPKEIDAESHSLFDWLPAGAIEKSPMLFAVDELPVWKVLLEEAWGSDAIIGLRSELPREELLAKFQELLMGSSAGPQSSKGILGFCWPSVLEALIENNSNGFTDAFFADVSLVLVEKQGMPEYWQLLGKDSQVEKAMKIGMRVVNEKAVELAK